MTTGNKPVLLVVDDEPSVLTFVRRHAEEAGYEVVASGGGAQALAAIPDVRPHLVLVDLQMPEVNGLDVLRAIRRSDPECQVVLMTGYASFETAVVAVKDGALDYLVKPFSVDRLAALLASVRESVDRRRRLVRAEAAIADGFAFEGMIGRSSAMEVLFDSLRRFAPHARTILVTGETGSGKELVARALHALGGRRARRFITINCSAVVPTLVESELFGHVRGSFTGATETKVGLFEHADGGTLFLDEIGELPLAMQAKLLRAVEYGEVQRVGAVESKRVDVVLIAATNRDLAADVAAATFRADLYYRLGVVELRVPPLRDRREDIPYLTAAFVRDAARRIGRPIAGVTPAAERLLQQAPWPGNVRQLRNVVERACILNEDSLLGERDVAAALAAGAGRDGQAGPPIDDPHPPAMALADVARHQIEKVLREVNGNKARAARLLGLSRRSLYRRLSEYQRTAS